MPSSEVYGFNPDFLGECMEFDLAMTHAHDDVPDCLSILINNTIAHRKISLLDVL